MEKEQIFEMPMPELGSLPPPACARHGSNPTPSAALIWPQRRGSLKPVPMSSASHLFSPKVS